VIGFIGHLLSALTGQFPQGFVHLLIAGGVGIVCGVFGQIARTINRPWGLVPAGIVAIILNNLIPFVSVALGWMPKEAAIGLVFPFLIVAVVINVVIASGILLIIRSLKVPEI